MAWPDYEEFKAYRDELHKFPYYTTLSEHELSEYDRLSEPPERFALTVAKRHPFTWLYHVVGMRPYDYQYKMLNDMFIETRVAGVTSRQIGKSFCLGGFGFWAARNNVKPTGAVKKTRIGIVSATEQQAKKLMVDIMDMIKAADLRYAQLTRGSEFHCKDYFSRELVSKSRFKIEWANATIECFPPTERVRGYSFSYLFIDEADFLDCENPDLFFASKAMPTVKQTQGSVFLWSTPRGTPSFFYNIIQPNNDNAVEGWKRIWFPWTISKEIDDLKTNWNERKSYISQGKELNFKIEYEASFLSGMHTYFHPEDIDEAVDESLSEEYDWSGPISVGLDFGDTHSRTVMVIVAHERERNETRLLWYKEFPAGYNNGDLPQFIKGLRHRYNIQQIVVDDCVGGKTAIELLRRDGFNLKMFQFKRDKHEYYEYLKVAFANKRIKFYRDPKLTAQFKGLESKETQQGNIKIQKPRGGNDDIVDAFMMACSPFIKPKLYGKRYVL